MPLSKTVVGRAVGGGVRVLFGGGDEVGADGVLVDVVASSVEVFGVADAVVGEASLPDGGLGSEAVGEASFDELHGALECDGSWGDEEVDMIWHDDEGVEEILTGSAVVLQGFEQEVGVLGYLEEAAAVVGSAGDKECAGACCSGGDRHGAIVMRVLQGKL